MYAFLNSVHVPPLISNIRPVPTNQNPVAPSIDGLMEISEPPMDGGYIPVNEPVRPIPMPRVLH